MKKLVMLAREITEEEIRLGIGKERSSTRLTPIYKTLSLRLPIKAGKMYDPAIPIDPFEGTPLIQMSLEYIPHHEAILYGTPAINKLANTLALQPHRTIEDPGKGTGSPFIAEAINSKKDDILILAPCDQFLTPAVTKAINLIYEKMEQKGFQCGTLLTTKTDNPAFSYIKVKDDKAIEFMLKGQKPKEDMIAETMLVCCQVGYLKEQLQKMEDVSIKQLQKIYPYKEEILAEIQEKLQKIIKLMNTVETPEEYLEKCPFTDFSQIIHRLLLDNMTFATVEYRKEWDDLGDWMKIYNSDIYPKDEDGNLVFSKLNHIVYTNCKNSIIANFTDKRIIVRDLEDVIFALGPRGAINIPKSLEPNEFKKDVQKIRM